MTVVSFAQNGEDIVLHRALGGAEAGLYVDAGASDPTVDSVTRLFYERGWRGINVEPARRSFAALEGERPEDVNLSVALGARPGSTHFYELPAEMTGCSTLDQDVATTYRADGWEIEERDVSVTTLAAICAEHVGERTIDFLKIDVEGHEASVIAGADFDRYRPRIVVVESLHPVTLTESEHEWEPLLLDHGYRCALFDGLNRFYVAEEDRALTERVAVPANVLDDYVTLRAERWRQASEELEAALARHRAAAATSERHQADLLETIERARDELARAQRGRRDAEIELAASRRGLLNALAAARGAVRALVLLDASSGSGGPGGVAEESTAVG